MRIREINITELEATIHNEIAPQLKLLVDSIKAGTPTDPQVGAVAKAVATGVRKAIVQAFIDVDPGPMA